LGRHRQAQTQIAEENLTMAAKNTRKSNGKDSTVAQTAHALFTNFAQVTSHASGHPFAFLLAVLVIVVWAITGPLFNYSDTWQLVINTGTTIVTFLMVFLIQNTQNRDTLALHLKLSEVIFAVKGAKNKYAALELLGEDELEALHADFCKRADQAAGMLHAHRTRRQQPPQRQNQTRRSRKPTRRRARS
jgi:low affinity Fe/Cu permease